jgi:hypothetical protein
LRFVLDDAAANAMRSAGESDARSMQRPSALQAPSEPQCDDR